MAPGQKHIHDLHGWILDLVIFLQVQKFSDKSDTKCTRLSSVIMFCKMQALM